MRTLFIEPINIPFRLLALVIFCSFLLAMGCGGKPTPTFAGTFVNDGKSEFSIASDTLIIGGMEDESFVIQRKTGIRLLDEKGKPGKLILEREEWKAELDTETGVLTERSKGRQLRLDGQSLTLENAVYRRVP